jgi:hypothetical protein
VQFADLFSEFGLNPASFRSLSNVHNFEGYIVNRVSLKLALLLTFGWIGVGLTAGRAAPPAPLPRVGVNPTAPVPSVRPNAANQVNKESEQTKVVRIYSGEGHFDPSLAENLRPMLVKAFRAPEIAGGPSAPKSGTEISLSILGRGAPENGGKQLKLAKSDQP